MCSQLPLLVHSLPSSVKVLRVSLMSFLSSTPSIVTSPPMQVYWNCSALTANKAQLLSDSWRQKRPFQNKSAERTDQGLTEL